MVDIVDYFKSLTYPGRIIIVGRQKNGALFISYAIMGRSVNSRNRHFVRSQNLLKTEVVDPSLLEDPSLIIYNAIIPLSFGCIFCNGDQSDTIASYLYEGKTLEKALETRAYENDPPSYTPRISGLLRWNEENTIKLNLSILKRVDEYCSRYFYSYDNIKEDTALIIHTYQDDGNPLLPFSGEPRQVGLSGRLGVQELSSTIFNSLNEENRISLYLQEINKNEIKDTVINKYQKVE